MNKVSRKQIEETVNNKLSAVITDLSISNPSKKTAKSIRKVSKRLAETLKQELKKQFRKLEKASKKAVNGKAHSRVLPA